MPTAGLQSRSHRIPSCAGDWLLWKQVIPTKMALTPEGMGQGRAVAWTQAEDKSKHRLAHTETSRVREQGKDSRLEVRKSMYVCQLPKNVWWGGGEGQGGVTQVQPLSQSRPILQSGMSQASSSQYFRLFQVQGINSAVPPKAQCQKHTF